MYIDTNTLKLNFSWFVVCHDLKVQRKKHFEHRVLSSLFGILYASMLLFFFYIDVSVIFQRHYSKSFIAVFWLRIVHSYKRPKITAIRSLCHQKNGKKPRCWSSAQRERAEEYNGIKLHNFLWSSVQKHTLLPVSCLFSFVYLFVRLPIRRESISNWFSFFYIYSWFVCVSVALSLARM